MVAIDTAIAFLHPLATIALACSWTLWILRKEYRPHLTEKSSAPEETQDEEVSSVEHSEGV